MYVANDENVRNSHGFRLMNGGAKLTRFMANPVLCYNHDASHVIGKCEDLKIEGSKLVFEAVYDEEDPRAKEIKGKVDRGFLRGVSPGLIVLDADYVTNIVTGEKELQVTEWELFEISICTIPSNAGALKLYNSKLEELTASDVVQLAMNKKPQNKDNKMKLSEEALKTLGLSADASEKAIGDAIVTLAKKHEEAVKQLTDLKHAKAKEIAELALKNGVISDKEKESFTLLALENEALAISLASKVVGAKNKGQDETPKEEPKGKEGKRYNLADAIERSAPGSTGDERSKWTYLEWSKKDPEGLEKMKNEEPERFEKLTADWK